MGNGEIVLYTTEGESVVIQFRAEKGEADLESTSKDYLLVQTEGERNVQREVKLYNLNMILAIGCRVHSARSIQ